VSPAAWAAGETTVGEALLNSAVSDVSASPAANALDPAVTYLRDASGAVLVDVTSKKPLEDDWWNAFVGVQANLVRGVDSVLRGFGVPQAFGWTIVLYTAFIKVLLLPFQETQVRNRGISAMVEPQLKRIKEEFGDMPEIENQKTMEVYETLKINPLEGCVPVLITLPVYIALFSIWRRLAAEKFPYFDEGWLWLPSLAYPNPDFNWSYNWLFDFTAAGAPTMGWDKFLPFLILPALLIANSVNVLAKQYSDGGKTVGVGWFSLVLITGISLELPSAMLLYYASNIFLGYAQDEAAKVSMRSELPGYEEFERTGEFPETASLELFFTRNPANNLHEAAGRGDFVSAKRLLDQEGASVDEPDESGMRPIGVAVAKGHLELVKVLLDRGADVTFVDAAGNTLLHYAAGYGHVGVLQSLLQAEGGAWPGLSWSELKNGAGQSVLDVAAANREDNMVGFLVETLGEGHPQVAKLKQEMQEMLQLKMQQQQVQLQQLAQAAEQRAANEANGTELVGVAGASGGRQSQARALD
jgi:YidC/Oxa1 family membrane protein insertase